VGSAVAVGALELTATSVAAVVLAAANLVPRYLGPLHPGRRRPLVSLVGGAAVAYVMVELLPHVAEAQIELEGTDVGELPFLDRHAFLLALVGLATFYGIEIAARSSRQRSDHGRTELETYLASMAAFVLYNALVGYLVVQQVDDDGAPAAVALTVALTMHIVVNDASLREHHQDRYEHSGRWVLAAAVLAGWTAGHLAAIPDGALAAVVAFLAGGITLNVLKEELPADREGHFGAFAAGAAGTAALLLAV
jgi:hypothetical protein